MGNRGSRSCQTIEPEIRASRNPIIFNTIEIKPAEVDNSKCKTCNKTGQEFTVVSRDGTTITKMYYCKSCFNNWKH